MGPLHVIAVYNNPRRWQSRLRLLREFIPHMLDSGTRLTLVQHAFGERPFEIEADDPLLRHVNHVQVRGGADQEIWIKEALQKLGVRSLPEEANYLALVDADINFQRADWAAETVHMLQHHRVGQPWSHAIDLAPDRTPLPNEWGNIIDRSFAAAWIAGDVDVPVDGYGPSRQPSRALLVNAKRKDFRQHYGFAWAIRKETYSAIGGLPDWLVTGSADFHSALAFAGKLSSSEAYISAGCTRRLREFAKRCDEHVRQDIGVVPGLIHHGFHGTKAQRNYLTRKDILVEANFDPDNDLTWDWQGIPSLAGDNRILRDGLRRMNMLRNEDANAV